MHGHRNAVKGRRPNTNRLLPDGAPLPNLGVELDVCRLRAPGLRHVKAWPLHRRLGDSRPYQTGQSSTLRMMSVRPCWICKNIQVTVAKYWYLCVRLLVDLAALKALLCDVLITVPIDTARTERKKQSRQPR